MPKNVVIKSTKGKHARGPLIFIFRPKVMQKLLLYFFWRQKENKTPEFLHEMIIAACFAVIPLTFLYYYTSTYF